MRLQVHLLDLQVDFRDFFMVNSIQSVDIGNNQIKGRRGCTPCPTDIASPFATSGNYQLITAMFA